MDKIETKYEITLRDLRALQNFTDWCIFYDFVDMFTDSVIQDKIDEYWVLREIDESDLKKATRDEKIAYEKLKIRECLKRFKAIIEDEKDDAHKTMNITIDDLRYLDSVLGGDNILKYFNLDTTKITSDHLTSKQLQKIIKALDETRKEYEDDGNHQLEVASLKFKTLYHKANVDKMSGRVN